MIGWWRRIPLRIRLVAAVVALVATGLAVSGFAATTALRSYLLARTDSQLVSSARGPGCGGPDGAGFHGGSDFPSSQFYVAVYSAGGGAARCVVPAYNSDEAPDIGSVASTAGQAATHTLTVGSVGSGPAWRAVIQVEQDGDVRVVATPLSDIEHTVSRLILLELLIGAAVLGALAVAGYAVIRQALKPLVDVEQTAAAIAAGDLSRRVPDHDPRTEVGRLTSALNTMLQQVETAFSRQRSSEQAARASEERMRRFVADASHELRTPLTSIRGFAELHRQGAVTDPTEVRRLMRRVEDEAVRMGGLVEDLLLLARLDEERPLEAAPVDLVTVVGDVVHDARAVAPQRSVELRVDGEPPIVTGDAARLHQVVQNLVTNALRHTAPDTAVLVRLAIENGNAVVEVVDRGPGLPPDLRTKVFERFFRADASRTRQAGGAGLGLAIVSALVAAHGGRVWVTDTPGGGATFRVELPLADTPMAHASAIVGDSERDRGARAPHHRA